MVVIGKNVELVFEKSDLPHRELNPGLLGESQVSQPLDHVGLDIKYANFGIQELICTDFKGFLTFAMLCIAQQDQEREGSNLYVRKLALNKQIHSKVGQSANVKNIFHEKNYCDLSAFNIHFLDSNISKLEKL